MKQRTVVARKISTADLFEERERTGRTKRDQGGKYLTSMFPKKKDPKIIYID